MPFILVNGRTDRNTEEESKFGKMVVSTKETGRMGKVTEKED